MSFIRRLLGKDASNEQPTEPTEAAAASSASGPGVLRSQDGGKDWAEPSPGSTGYGDWEYIGAQDPEAAPSGLTDTADAEEYLPPLPLQDVMVSGVAHTSSDAPTGGNDGADALVWDAGDGSDIAAKGEHIEIESWSPGTPTSSAEPDVLREEVEFADQAIKLNDDAPAISDLADPDAGDLEPTGPIADVLYSAGGSRTHDHEAVDETSDEDLEGGLSSGEAAVAAVEADGHEAAHVVQQGAPAPEGESFHEGWIYLDSPSAGHLDPANKSDTDFVSRPAAETGIIEATPEPAADAAQLPLDDLMITSFTHSGSGEEPAGDAGGIGINEKWMRGDSGISNASDAPGAAPGDVAAPSDAAGYDFPGDYAQPFDGIAEAGAESEGEPDVIADAGGGTQPMTVGRSQAPTVGGTQTGSVGAAQGVADEPPGDLATGEPHVGPAAQESVSFIFQKVDYATANDASSQEPVDDLLDEDESPLLVTLEEGTRPMTTMATGDVDLESPDTVDVDDDAEEEPVQTVQGLIPGEVEPVDAAMASGASGPGVLRSQDGGKDSAEPPPDSAASDMWDYGYGDTGTHEGQEGDAPEAAFGTDVEAAASGAPVADIGTNEKWIRGDSGSWNADAGPSGATPLDVFGQVVLGPVDSPAPAQNDAFYVDETGVIEATVTPPAQQATPRADADDALADRVPPPEAESGWYATEPYITLGSTDPPADSAGASIPPEFKAVVGGLDDGGQATSVVSADRGDGADDMPAPMDAPANQGGASVVGETPAPEVYDSPADINNLHVSSVKPSSSGPDAPAGGQADIVVATGAGDSAPPVGGNETVTIHGQHDDASGPPDTPSDVAAADPDGAALELEPVYVKSWAHSSGNDGLIDPPEDGGPGSADQLAAEDWDDEGSPLLVSLDEGAQPLSLMPEGEVEVDASETAEGLVDADEPDL